MAARKKAAGASGEGAEKVHRAGIAREDDKFLYYVEKNGDVVRMQRGVPKAPTEVIARTGLKREKGWMYYVDLEGDVSREPDSD